MFVGGWVDGFRVVGGWWDGFRVASSMATEYTVFTVLVAILFVLVLAAALRYHKFSNYKVLDSE